ncbi:hypothetical protein [Pseudobacteriovorax antillogorgiicola]|uniref:Uncharacterized protein n=1 Tax=Pseudobacteriovorax antillogorgiicola TaxID=1513793 RepID=A0A1Y6BK99_9BACT|nr:hypothetical protein [Pseudobacteriovorax antillogorgiicola]TCS54720.1 hypothetical protein EDD56_106233 [Pseudobacteriovorax antillogorgiicola]SMF16030.1 hypothetical protein SAMN06296036_10610 [Pseudobacteriovorax antillogorgiicola]
MRGTWVMALLLILGVTLGAIYFVAANSSTPKFESTQSEPAPNEDGSQLDQRVVEAEDEEQDRSAEKNGKKSDVLVQDEVIPKGEPERIRQDIESIRKYFPKDLQERIVQYENQVRALKPRQDEYQSLMKAINEEIIASQGDPSPVKKERADELREELMIAAKRLGREAREISQQIADEVHTIKERYDRG